MFKTSNTKTGAEIAARTRRHPGPQPNPLAPVLWLRTAVLLLSACTSARGAGPVSGQPRATAGSEPAKASPGMTDDTDERALTPTEQTYVGEYRSGGVDSMAGLTLLPDGTFCFFFMGGALDHLAAGHWRSAPDGAGILLREVREDAPPIVPWARRVEPSETTRTQPAGTLAPQVTLAFHGYSLSNALDPVFAVSSADAPAPGTFRPLFSPDMTSWAERYALPAMARDEARFLFLGYVTAAEKNGDPAPLLRVWQFEVGESEDIVVAFDMMQAAPKMNLPAALIDDVLHLEDRVFGKRHPLSEELAQQAREDCVEPILARAKGRPSIGEDAGHDPAESGDEQEDEDEGRTRLIPIRAMELDVRAIQGAPWFQSE